MSDCISREAALARLRKIVEVNRLRTDRAWFTPDGVEYLINEIPAADVRPVPKGQWVELPRNTPNPITGKCGVYVGCSNCHAALPTDNYLDFMNESDSKFCYSCGAIMGGADE